MPCPTLTLKEFFRYRRENVSAQALKEIEATSTCSLLKNKLGQTLRWPGAFDMIMDSLDKLLDSIDLYRILTETWQEDADYEKFSDAGKYPPNETVLVPLANHAIRSEHHPRLELFLGDRPLGHIDIKIDLLLQLSGFIVEISQRHIESIHTGTLSGEGRVFCEAVELLHKTSGEIDIPGKILFGRQKDPAMP